MIFNSPISGRPWATARCPRHVEVRHERPLKGMNWAAGKLTVMTVGNGSVSSHWSFCREQLVKCPLQSLQ